MVDLSIPELSAMNLLGLVEARLEEIEQLALAHPDLPMRDPNTIASYKAAQTALENGLSKTRLAERQRLYGLVPGERDVR